jgi:hypothetical protein
LGFVVLIISNLTPLTPPLLSERGADYMDKIHPNMEKKL